MKKNKELKKLLPAYIKALRLGDWEINLSLVSPTEMKTIANSENDVLGYCIWNSHDRVAEVFVLKYKHHKKLVDNLVYSNRPTQEETLVHELLHIVLHDYEVDTIRLEQVINTLASQVVNEHSVTETKNANGGEGSGE